MTYPLHAPRDASSIYDLGAITAARGAALDERHTIDDPIDILARVLMLSDHLTDPLMRVWRCLTLWRTPTNLPPLRDISSSSFGPSAAKGITPYHNRGATSPSLPPTRRPYNDDRLPPRALADARAM